ncbi:MAG: hypothetical protein R3C09_18725 [Pirellulaceae bacterium]
MIGTTWCQAMAASQSDARFKKSTESPHQIEKAEREHAVEVLKKRVGESGMFVVHQDIYLRPDGSDFADIVYPQRLEAKKIPQRVANVACGCIASSQGTWAMRNPTGGSLHNSQEMGFGTTTGRTATMSSNRPPEFGRKGRC